MADGSLLGVVDSQIKTHGGIFISQDCWKTAGVVLFIWPGEVKAGHRGEIKRVLVHLFYGKTKYLQCKAAQMNRGRSDELTRVEQRRC